MVKTLEEMLKENGISTNQEQKVAQPQQQVVNQQPPNFVPSAEYVIPTQQVPQQAPVQTQVVTQQVQQSQQQQVVPVQTYNGQSQQQQGNFYKPTVLMSSEDVSNLDIKKFLGDATGGGVKLEEDFYLVECVGIELITDKDFNSGLEVNKYRFSLKVLSSSSGTPIDGVVLHKKTSLSFGDRSNNYAIYKAFMGHVPQGQYNILECKGKRCMIRVENKPSSTGGTFSVITLFAPAPKK